MNCTKLPKWLYRLPRYWSRKPIRYLFLLHVVIFLLVSHVLTTYRQPVEQIVTMIQPRYWLWLGIGAAGLAVMALYMVWMGSLIWKFRDGIPRWALFLLLLLLVAVVPIFLTWQGLHGTFYLIGMDIRASGYLENEFVWLCGFIVVYHAWWIYFIVYRENRRLHVQSAYHHRLNCQRREEERLRRFGDFTTDNFMVWTEKNKDYKVAYTGEVTPVHWPDEKERQALLHFGYIRINRWVYVKKGIISNVDPGKERLVLRSQELRILQSMDETQGIYRYFLDKINLSNGILTFTKRYIQEAESRQEKLGDG